MGGNNVSYWPRGSGIGSRLWEEFFWWNIFHGMYELSVSMSQYPLSIFCPMQFFWSQSRHSFDDNDLQLCVCECPLETFSSTVHCLASKANPKSWKMDFLLYLPTNYITTYYSLSWDKSINFLRFLLILSLSHMFRR